MTDVVGDGLLAQVDDGGNGHGVPAEDVGQVLTDAAGAAGRVVVTGSGVGVYDLVVGVAGAVHGFGGGGRSGAVGALRARLGSTLRGLLLSLGTVVSLGTEVNFGTAVGIGRGAIGGGVSGVLIRALFRGGVTRGGVTRGGVARGVVARGVVDVSSVLIRFGHGPPSRLGASRLLGVLGRGLVPALGGEGMHLGLLGGHGHRLEHLGERIGGTRRGEGSRRNGGTGVIGALELGSAHRLGGHDDLDRAGDRTHVLGLLSGVHAP